MNDARPPRPVADAAAVAARVKATVRPKVRALKAYPVAKATGMIKLDAMENPYGLSGEARAEIAAAVANARINRYPDGGGDEVKAALRHAFALPPEVGLVLGNGSDEILQMLTAVVASPARWCWRRSRRSCSTACSAELANLRFVGVPLRADLTLDIDAMLAAIARDRPALVWLAYPQQPDRHAVRRGATSSGSSPPRPGVVAVDEAYYAFADASFLPRVLEFANLIVVRTLSKVGMAGVRLGYAAAHPAWIAELDKVRPPYNVNIADSGGGAGAPAPRAAAGRAGRGDPPRARAHGRGAGRVAPGHRVSLARQLPAGARSRRRRTGSRRCGRREFW